MTPEEYQKIKEAEKEHLLKLKELKKAHRDHSRHAKVTKAVTDMATGMNDLYDEHQEMVDRLHLKAATSEARMEVALDSVDTAASEAADTIQLEQDQETLKKARAQELVRQMKQEGSKGMSDGPTDSKESTHVASGQRPAQVPLPEKTIGKMKP